MEPQQGFSLVSEMYLAFIIFYVFSFFFYIFIPKNCKNVLIPLLLSDAFSPIPRIFAYPAIFFTNVKNNNMLNNNVKFDDRERWPRGSEFVS